MAMNTADGALYFKTSDNTVITAHDNTIMHIDSLNDRVGIGTTSPDKPLDVLGDIRSIDGSSNQHQLRATQVISYGTDAILNAQSTGDDVRLNTQGTTRLIATAEGNVGIGTTSPATALEVAGDITLPSNGQLKFKGTNHYPRIYAQSNDLLINLDNGSGFNYTALKIDNVTGNIGIGTTTPGEKLEVVGNVEAEEFIGDLRGALLFKAQAGEALSKGDVVYISGISGNTTVVSKADADDSAKMPAFGVVAAAATLNSSVDIYTFGTLSGIDTSSYSEGDELYVSTTAGAMTNSAPTGSGSLLQKIAKVTRSDASVGSIKVIGAGRTNAVPNLDQYKIFVGNSSNQAVQGNNALTVDIDNNAVGINTGDPDAYVSSLGAGLHIGTDVVLNSNTPLFYLRANGGTAMSEIRYQNSLKFTNGAGTLHGFIDSSGRLTFGNATNFSDANADDFQIGNTSGAHGISIVAQNSHNASIYFADNDNNDAGRIIYNHTNNRMEFYTNRSQRMVITSAGNVGIGTNAAAEKLEVRDGDITTRDSTNTNYAQLNRYAGLTLKGNGTGSRGVQTPNTDALTLGTNNTERVRISGGGNVGINQSSPTKRLHLKNSANDDDNVFLVEASGSTTYGVYIKSSYATQMGRIGAMSQSDGDLDGASIAFEDFGRDIAFRTNEGSNNSEKARLLESGEFGIGTSSPSSKLHVSDATAPTFRLSRTGTGQIWQQSIDSSGRFLLQEAASEGGTKYTRLAVDDDGQVGIGATSPSTMLHIKSAAPNIRLEDSDNTSYGEIIYNTAAGGLIIRSDENNAAGSTGSNIIFETDGSERIRILSNGNTIFGGTSVGAAGAMSVKVDGTYTDLYLYGAGTSQGGRIFFGDSSDRSSITGTYGTGGGGKLSFKTDTTGGTSQDRLVIDSDGSIRFNNAFTFPTSIGSAGQVLKVPSTGSTLVWASDAGGGSATVLTDTDGDTKIQVEESADEDIIRFDIAGTEQMVLNSTGLTVAGNLTVNGTQTVLNTATLSVDDLNITVADGAADAAAANGAGLTVDGANATWTYSSGDDAWASNKHAQFYTGGGTGTLSVGRTSDQALRLYADDNYNRIFAYQDADSNQDHFFDLVRSFAGTGKADMRFMNGTAVHMLINKDGKVGIGTDNPGVNLQINDSTTTQTNSEFRIYGYDTATSDAKYGRIFIDTGGNLNVAAQDSYLLLSSGNYIQANDTIYALEDILMRNNKRIQMAGSDGGFNGVMKVSTGDVVQVGGVSGWGGTIGQLALYSNDAEAVRIDENQFVGIGTTSPLATLHVGSGSGTVNTPAELFIPTGDALMRTLKIGHGSSTASITTDDSSKPITFTAGGSEKVRIDTSGRVGIGTTSPALQSAGTGLHINSTDHAEIKFTNTTTGSTASDGTALVATGSGFQINNREAGSILFRTSNTTAVTIDSSGSVGIGTTPGAKLHVNSSGTIGWTNLANAFILAGTTSAGIGFDNNEIMAKGSGALYFGTGDSGDDVVIRAGGTTAAMTISGTNQRVGIAKSIPLARFQVEEYGIDTTGVTTTSTSQAAIHSFPITSFRSARFTIQITNTTDSTYHSTEILAIHDGTTANITEFGEVHTGSSVEATFDADISSGNFRLLATPTSTNSMAFKVVCHSITV